MPDASNNENAAPLVLSIRALRKKRIQGRAAFYSLSVPLLDIRLGEKILVTGSSGCGKSTLLDIIGLVLQPDQAEQFLFFPERHCQKGGHPEPVTAQAGNVALAWSQRRMEDLALWRRTIGYVLQTGGLLPFVNVRENILIPCRLLGLSSVNFFPGPEARQSRGCFLARLVEELGVASLLQKFPSELSVGERQRVAIARALAVKPPLVLADEPTAALDPANASRVLRLFSHAVEQSGCSLVMVTHAPEQVAGMGFRHFFVSVDRVEEEGVTGTTVVLSEIQHTGIGAR